MARPAAPAAVLVILLSSCLWTSHACGNCQTEQCISYVFGSSCHCLPSNEHCSTQQASNNAVNVIQQEGQHISQTVINQLPTASSAVQLANACVADVYGCATSKMLSYVPNLDTQVCSTAASKAKFEQGGWSSYYGPRIWDSEAAGTVIGLFFPATAAVAAAKLQNELNKQLAGLEQAVDTALAEVNNKAYNKATDLYTKLFDDLLSGRAPNGQATLDLGKLGVKLHFFYVKCNNNVAGLILPSEGYSRWAFGWRFDPTLSIGTQNLLLALPMGKDSQLPAGRPDRQLPKTTTRNIVKNGCPAAGTIEVGTTILYPNATVLPKGCLATYASGERGTAAKGGDSFWCILAWWMIPPGGSVFVGQTNDRYIYYTAKGQNGQIWGSNTMYWTFQHASCVPGASDCYSWTQVDTGPSYTDFTETLTCPTA